MRTADVSKPIRFIDPVSGLEFEMRIASNTEMRKTLKRQLGFVPEPYKKKRKSKCEQR